ncbi:MAG: hypothetical protein ACM3PO_00080 [Betaproteobacteria bacterium]
MAGIEFGGLPWGAHYSGRLLHGKLTDGMGTPSSGMSTIKPDRPRSGEGPKDEV